MDFRQALALSVLGIKKEDVQGLMDLTENNSTSGHTEDSNDSSNDSVNTDKTEDNDLKNLTEIEDGEKTDYKKLSEDLKSEIDKLKSDLTSIQAENTGKNIAHNKEKTTLEDLFRDIM